MLKVYQKIAEISTSSIVVTDDESNIVYVNEAFTETTGYTYLEVMGKNPRLLKGDGPNINYKEMWDTLKSGREWSGEFYNKDKFGNHFWEFARIAPVVDGDKLYYVAVKQNITKIVCLEEKLSCLCEKVEKVHLKDGPSTSDQASSGT